MTTGLAARPRPTADQRAPRDLQAWVAGVKRTAQPLWVEWCSGTPAQRDRLESAVRRRGCTPRSAPEVAPESLVPRALGRRGSTSGPEAEVRRRSTGSMRGRVLWVAPHALPGAGPTGSRLGVLLTDDPALVLALLDAAAVGPAPLGQIASGTRWTASVHSVGVPLDDEHGEPVREDAPWPRTDDPAVIDLPGGGRWALGHPGTPAVLRVLVDQPPATSR